MRFTRLTGFIVTFVPWKIWRRMHSIVGAHWMVEGDEVIPKYSLETFPYLNSINISSIFDRFATRSIFIAPSFLSSFFFFFWASIILAREKEKRERFFYFCRWKSGYFFLGWIIIDLVFVNIFCVVGYDLFWCTLGWQRLEMESSWFVSSIMEKIGGEIFWPIFFPILYIFLFFSFSFFFSFLKKGLIWFLFENRFGTWLDYRLIDIFNCQKYLQLNNLIAIWISKEI